MEKPGYTDPGYIERSAAGLLWYKRQEEKGEHVEDDEPAKHAEETIANAIAWQVVALVNQNPKERLPSVVCAQSDESAVQLQWISSPVRGCLVLDIGALRCG